MIYAKRKPWMKWYPSDWRGEQLLRLVSREARSVWVDLLGLMHESTLIGTLFVNGEIPTVAKLAKMFGDDPTKLDVWIKELVDNGVCSVDESGALYSRKMRHAAQISEKGREDVKKRGGSWAPGKKATKPKSIPKGDPNRGAIGDPMSQRLETRTEEKKESSSSLKAKVNEPEPEAHAPAVHVAIATKPKADVVPLHPQGTKSKREQIFDGLATALGWPPEKLYRHTAFENFASVYADWVAKGCDADKDIWPTISKLAKRAEAKSARISSPFYFEDAIFAARDDRMAALPTPSEMREKLRGAVGAFKLQGWWHDDFGPKPFEPGCTVPAEIIREIFPENSAAMH